MVRLDESHHEQVARLIPLLERLDSAPPSPGRRVPLKGKIRRQSASAVPVLLPGAFAVLTALILEVVHVRKGP